MGGGRQKPRGLAVGSRVQEVSGHLGKMHGENIAKVKIRKD